MIKMIPGAWEALGRHDGTYQDPKDSRSEYERMCRRWTSDQAATITIGMIGMACVYVSGRSESQTDRVVTGRIRLGDVMNSGAEARFERLFPHAAATGIRETIV